MQDVITVHHLNNSRSQRVLWLLEELAIPYELVKYERDPKTMLAPKALEAIHPLGKSPVITDGDKTVAESGAILEYLVETYGKGRFIPAAGTQARIDYRYFMHYAEGSLMPLPAAQVDLPPHQDAGAAARAPDREGDRGQGQRASSSIRTSIRHVTFLGNHLASPVVRRRRAHRRRRPDVFPVEAAVARGGNIADVSKLAASVEKIKQRPAFKAAIERGGPYDLDG